MTVLICAFAGVTLSSVAATTNWSRETDSGRALWHALRMGEHVVICGAGLSKAISGAMPLLRELPDLIDKVHPGILDRQQLHARFDDNLERYLSFLAIDQPYLREPDNLRNRARFLETSEAIADIVLEAQNAALEAERPWWVGQLITAWDRDRATVLTLNYDHLIEKAAEATLRAEERFTVEFHGSNLWAVPVTNVLLRRAAMWGGPETDTFRLLKLHGSLGWRYSGSTTFFGETIYHVALSAGWNADAPEKIRQAAPDKVPLIVPPTAGKSVFFNNETVRAQWTMAADAVRRADRITLLGYSMPDTDDLVGGLLRLASVEATVTVVDPSDTAAERVEALMGHPVDRFTGDGTDTVAKYVASSTSLSTVDTDPDPVLDN